MENTQEPRESKQVLTLPLAILIAGIVIAGAIVYTRDQSPQAVADENSPAADTHYGPENMQPITNKDHILGNPNAPVKIVEYSDLECPYCKDFHEVLHDTMNRFGKDGNVAWIYRNFPLTKHPKGFTEAHAAECIADQAGEDAYWTYIDKIFAVTPSNNGLDLNLLTQIGQEKVKGFDLAKFNACQSSNKFRDKINASVQDGIASGITGTPTSFVISPSGKVYPIGGWVSSDAMKQIVELALQDKL